MIATGEIPVKKPTWRTFRIYLRYAFARFNNFMSPDEEFLHLVKGWFYAKRGHFDRSIEESEKALRLKPNSFIARWNLSHAYFEKGQCSEALLECRKALEIRPREYVGPSFLTRYAGREERNIAVGLLQKVIELDPNFGGAYEQLGYIYADSKQWEKASSMLEKAIALGVTSPHVYLNLGRACEVKGCWDGALQKYREAIDHASNHIFIEEVNDRIRWLEKGTQKTGLNCPMCWRGRLENRSTFTWLGALGRQAFPKYFCVS